MQITVDIPHTLTETRLPYNYLNVSFYSILTEEISFQDLLCAKIIINTCRSMNEKKYNRWGLCLNT